MAGYDEDFVQWTQEQAALLRTLSAGSGLDVDNLAEEIEAAGREAVSQLSKHLRIVLTNVITLSNSAGVIGGPGSVECAQSEAILAAGNGVERHIDLSRIWQLAEREARLQLEATGYPLPALPETCPFPVDQLLAVDFDVNEAVQIVRSEVEQQKTAAALAILDKVPDAPPEPWDEIEQQRENDEALAVFNMYVPLPDENSERDEKAAEDFLKTIRLPKDPI